MSPTTVWTWCAKVLATCGLLMAAVGSLAHPAPGSQLLLNMQREQVKAEIRIPLIELQVAFKKPLVASPEQAVAANATALRLYLHEHLQVLTPDGNAWVVRLAGLRADTSQQPAELVVESEWTPPGGGSIRKFTIKFDAVAHEIPNHTAVITLRNDWESGALSEESARILGTIRFNYHAIPIDLGPRSNWAGLKSAVALGMQHIAAGTDHLLFLLVLLLPAPLVADLARRRWGQFGGARRSLIQLLKIVTAFTIGHSLTLSLGAVDWVRLPSKPVEIVIALSILVSAVHAWRPLFAGKEMFIAAGFGLVHGMAFAGVVADMGLRGLWLMQAILGFNVGIELMQLLIVALVFPLLMVMARTPYYSAVRVPLAIFAAVAAGSWVVERVTGASNPLSKSLEVLSSYPVIAWLALLVATGAILALSRLRRPPPVAHP